jgi:hypothetical protein
MAQIWTIFRIHFFGHFSFLNDVTKTLRLSSDGLALLQGSQSELENDHIDKMRVRLDNHSDSVGSASIFAGKCAHGVT